MSRTQTDDTNRSWWAWGCSADLAPSDIKRYKRAQYLVLLWVAVLAAVVFTLKQWQPEPGPLAYALAALPGVMMAVAFLAYANFLIKADELTRKIQLEGMAVGFGVGLVAMLGYSVLELVGAPEMDSSEVILISILAALAVITRQQRKYR